MHKLGEKKVIFLFIPGPIGGAERIVLFGMKALIEQGVNASLWIIKEERVPHVAEAFSQLLIENGIEFHVLSTQSVFDPGLLKTLKTLLQLEKPEILHAHGFKAAFYGKLAAPKSSHFIITHHGKTGHTLKVRLYEFIEDQIMKMAKAVIAVSKEMQKNLAASGINETKIIVVENFMTSRMVPKTSTGVVPYKLLFVGRLSPEKGCSVLVEAMKLVDPKIFHLTIVGDGIERKNLEQQVLNRKLQESIHFAGFQKNVNSFMASSDAIVMPSYREGQPLTLIEACCMGLPIVASRVGGIPDLVVENKNGFLCQAGNVIELSETLVKFSENVKDLQDQANQLKSKYNERFSSKTWATNTIKVYEIVLSQR
jgi:glycosyltransferase involved in cell wall biosynthesis